LSLVSRAGFSTNNGTIIYQFAGTHQNMRSGSRCILELLLREPVLAIFLYYPLKLCARELFKT